MRAHRPLKASSIMIADGCGPPQLCQGLFCGGLELDDGDGVGRVKNDRMDDVSDEPNDGVDGVGGDGGGRPSAADGLGGEPPTASAALDGGRAKGARGRGGEAVDERLDGGSSRRREEAEEVEEEEGVITRSSVPALTSPPPPAPASAEADEEEEEEEEALRKVRPVEAMEGDCVTGGEAEDAAGGGRCTSWRWSSPDKPHCCSSHTCSSRSFITSYDEYAGKSRLKKPTRPTQPQRRGRRRQPQDLVCRARCVRCGARGCTHP